MTLLFALEARMIELEALLFEIETTVPFIVRLLFSSKNISWSIDY